MGKKKKNYEVPNTASTTGTAYITDMLCEGEIEGMVNGDESLFFDEVGYKTNGVSTFPSVNFNYATDVKLGTSSQTKFDKRWAGANIPAKLGNNTELRYQKPRVHYVSTSIYPDAVGATVSIRFGQFLDTDNEKGNINKTSVRFTISVSANGGSFQPKKDVNVEHKSNEGFIQSFYVPLERDNSRKFNSWKIKIVRLTPDSDSVKIQNTIALDSIVINTDNQYRYPNTAIAKLQFDSRTFPNMPQRSYELKLLKVYVPSNYTPTVYNSDRTVQTAASYSGVWDGTFSASKVWTDNPAWIYYDLLTNKRYGLGDFVDSDQIDKWTLYSIAQYCDELVDDGYGGSGQEPRFTANLLLTTTEEAYTVLSHLASIFRGMTYWLSNKIFISQDRYKDATQSFTNANVVDGAFNYSSSKRAQRRTMALVRWNDPDDFYRPKYERVEDDVGVLKYGIREMEIAAFGCSSRGQAIRAGQWALYTERVETEFINFQVAYEGLYSRPGDIIKVYDDFRIARKQGGRVLDMNSGATRVFLDREILDPSGIGYQITLQIPRANRDPAYTGSDADILIDSSDQVDDIRKSFLETRNVTSIASSGGNTYVDVSPAFSTQYIGNVFIMDATGVDSDSNYKSKLYRLMSVKENAEDNTFELMGLEFNSGKFASSEEEYTSTVVTDINYSGFDIGPPQNLVLEPAFDTDGGSAWVSVVGSWEDSTGEYVDSYVASGRLSTDDSWSGLETFQNNTLHFGTNLTGTYEVSVRAVQIGGRLSEEVSDSIVPAPDNPFTGVLPEEDIVPPMGEINIVVINPVFNPRMKLEKLP